MNGAVSCEHSFMAVTLQIILWLLNIYLVYLWLPCPPHLLCVCVSTQGSVLCVRSECVIFSAPPWPYALPFPPSVCFAGGRVGLPFWFGKWVLEILAGRKPHKGLQKPPMVQLREGMVQCRKARFSLCISLFLQVWSHFFTFMWQSKGRLALPF